MSKPKIKKVIHTKSPTLRQLENMSINLRHKFDADINVSTSSWFMTHLTKPFFEFNLYISINDPSHETFSTWSELQDKYFSLMES